jgi:hypothetical protein
MKTLTALILALGIAACGSGDSGFNKGRFVWTDVLVR